MTAEAERWWIMVGANRDRVSRLTEVKRCELCAALVIVTDEDDHARWHVSLTG